MADVVAVDVTDDAAGALSELAAWWRRVDRGWRAVAVAGIVTLIVQTGLTVPY